MLKNVVYQKGKIVVTPEIFKTARRTYKISRIERIQIKRPLFVFSVPLSLFCFLLLDGYSRYLYQYEIYACCFLVIGLPLISYNIGTLSVTSKSYTSDSAITGFMPVLKNIRVSLESVIYENSNGIIG